MRKVCDWVFGSFFRTIGRVMVFVLIGFILSYLIDFNDILGDFKITNLFFEKVKASSYDSWYIENFYNNSSTPMPHNSEFWAYSYINSNARTNDIWFNSSRTDSGKGVSILSKTNEVIFNFLIQIPGASVYDCDLISSTSQLNGVWNNTTTGEGGALSPIIYKYNNISCDHESNTFSFVLRQIKDNGTSVGIPCSVNNVNINEEHMYVTATCPIMQHVTDLSRMTIFAYQDTQPQTGVKYNINHTMILNYDSSSAVTDAINSQSQQQQQQHNETQSYLEDTNTTQANSQGEDFINNFGNNTHGLTGIITAPLNAIQSLTSATCSNLVLPLPFTNNKTLNLPCMSSIYTNHFGVFYTMYQGIILALISYWVCVRLFTLVKGFKDPDDDKIEVIDL